VASPHCTTMRDLQALPTPQPVTDPWAGPSVPPGHTVATGYVPIHDVVCHATFGHQLSPAEVERSYRRQLELEDAQSWPPPTGHWSGGRFVLTDGRHRYVAALMLGVEFLFVAWLQPPTTASPSRPN
jgi:hypothetical protein